MARFVSLVMTVFILVPVLAPSLGQLILFVADWRMIFLALFLLGFATLIWFGFRQKETLARERRVPLSLSRIWLAAAEVIKTRAALGYTLVAGLIFSAFIGYLTISQQIFQDIYKVGDMFAVYFGALAVALGLSSFMNARLVVRFGMQRLCFISLVGLTLISSLYALYTYSTGGVPPFWSVILFLTFLFFCFGILFGNFNALAMEPLGHIAGVASAVIGSVTTFMSMSFGTMIAQLFDGTLIPLTLSLAGLGALSLTAMIWTERTSRKAAD